MTDFPNDDDETLRIAHDFGRAFDQVALVRPGDEALIARVVDRTPGLGNRRVAVRRWGPTAAVAAGLLLVAGGAAAYWVGSRSGLFGEPPPPQSDGTVRPAPRASGAALGRSSISPAPSAEPVPAAAPDPGSRPRGGAVPRASAASRTSDSPRTSEGSRASSDGRSIVRPATRFAAASPVPTVPPPPTSSPRAARPATSSDVSGDDVTPAELFRRAGAARRAGSLAAACALYDDLQARFPGAEEARLSHVSLGKLLLVLGRPQEAERHFATYLAGGAGALAAEAAFGRAQSFEKMRRPREEREAWQALLRYFPGSVYEAAAQSRIAALDESGVGFGQRGPRAMIRATTRGRAAAAVAAVAVTWSIAVTPSRAAAPAPALPSAAADVVLIGETARTDELADLLIELLGGKGIAVRLTHKPVFRADDLLSLGDGRERSVSVFIEVPSDRVARLFFRGPRAARFLLRELGLRSGLDDVGREAVAQVVESSVAVLLSFSSQGMSRDEARAALARAPSPPPAPGTVVDLDPRPAPGTVVDSDPRPAAPPPRAAVAAPAQPPATTRAGWHGWLAARYALEYAGADLGPAHGPGAEAALERERARLIVRARLVADRRFVQVIASRALDADVRDEGARLLFELGWAPDTHRALSVGLGAGVDVSSIHPGAAHATDVTPTAGTTHVIPVTRVELRYEIGGTGWRVAALVFADASLFATHYDLDRAGSLQRLATPWPVRPGAAVVIGVRN